MVSSLSQAGKRPGATIVYVATQQETIEVARTTSGCLNSDSCSGQPFGVMVRSYHGSMSPEERSAAHQAFMTGACTIIVATLAYGMGIDKPDVRRVVHWGPPQSIEQN